MPLAEISAGKACYLLDKLDLTEWKVAKLTTSLSKSDLSCLIFVLDFYVICALLPRCLARAQCMC